MATIYDAETAVTITEGFQGSSVCDEAIISAKSLAEMREEDVILDDDDGYWLVSPDGGVREIGAAEAKSIGFDPHPAWKVQWVDESQLPFEFSDLMVEAYEALEEKYTLGDTDDARDEAVNARLDGRGLRKLFADGYKLDSESSRDDFYDAVLAGTEEWAKSLETA